MNNDVCKIVKLALNEDIGTGDVSASLLKNNPVSANIIARQTAVVCGVKYVQQVFKSIDKHVEIDWHVTDGGVIVANQTLCTIKGATRSILSGERVALNFLQTHSAVATQTRFLVDKIAHTNAQLLDTRKTIPGLRQAQKYAVECGGGVNHRMGLYDCVMLKENHIMSADSIRNAVQKSVEKYPDLPLIVEVENLTQLSEVLALSGINRILCDNFSIQDLTSAVTLAKNRVSLEASGNIDKDNIAVVAETGVDYISTGSITKHIQAIDLSLETFA